MKKAVRNPKPASQPRPVRNPKSATKPKAASKRLIVSGQPEAAELLGIGVRQLRNWIKEPGFPTRENGYDISKIKEWRDARDLKGSTADKERLELNLQTIEAKLHRQQIAERREQIELEAIERRLLPSELIRELLALLATMLRETTREIQRRGDAASASLLDEMLERYEKAVEGRLRKPKAGKA